MFLGKGVLKICSKFIGKHPCRSMISPKLLFNKGPLVNYALFPIAEHPNQQTIVDKRFYKGINH